MRVCRRVLQILTKFQTKQCNLPHPFSNLTSKIYTRFQTWLFGRNYAIIRAQTKRMVNPFRIRIFLFLPFSVIPSKTIPDSRPNGQSVSDPFSDQNGAKTLFRWGGTYTYIAYIREYPGVERDNLTQVRLKKGSALSIVISLFRSF